MALDTSVEMLGQRIDGLRAGFAGHRQEVLVRNRAYLRAYSPPFETRLMEHDQWQGAILQREDDTTRSSYNLTRGVVELWAALEMSEMPAIRWDEGYLMVPPPSLDEVEQEARQQIYRAQKLMAQTIATAREQAVLRHARKTRLIRHLYRAVRKKNIYGHSWIKVVPDRDRRTFQLFSEIDPSTVFPVWSAYESERLEMVLCATRRSAQVVDAQWPGSVQLDGSGLFAGSLDGYYNPTNESVTDADRAFVWLDDFWQVDAQYEQEVTDGPPVRGMVVNCQRVGGTVVRVVEYPGWTRLPYVLWHNENERDRLGFSDAATMLPIQDTLNRVVSQQQDVIDAETNPKFKYRGDVDREISVGKGEIVSLDPDEDIEQINVDLNVFPVATHVQQVLELMSRSTGLSDSVWGKISAAQNSGKALAQAWKAVGARLTPRALGNAASMEVLIDLELGWMELYDWDDAASLFKGNRDYELVFPNQEPRDFAEVTLNALNRLAAGVIDSAKAMEETGERSPDEMLDRVRAEYMDTVLHPEKGQSYLLLTQLRNRIAIEIQQAGQQQAALEAQLAALKGMPPGGAPGPGSVEKQAAAATQARTQAAQQAAPTKGQDQSAPGTMAGQAANASKTTVGTLVQDGGEAQNRIIDQSVL